MIYKLKPEYFPLIQKPLMCNVTCLQMILFRCGYRLAQDFIAKEIKNYDGYKTVEHADRVNKFLKENKLPFKAISFKASEIDNLKEFIISSIKENNDLWVELDNKIMYKTSGGHDCLIQSINTKTNKVTLVDPYGLHDQIYEVSLSKLSKAISKTNRERGFLLVEMIKMTLTDYWPKWYFVFEQIKKNTLTRIADFEKIQENIMFSEFSTIGDVYMESIINDMAKIFGLTNYDQTEILKLREFLIGKNFDKFILFC